MTMHRYQPRSPLQAIDPKAFFGLFAAVEDPENEDRDDAVIVTIRGPLTQHSSWWEDSYEAIRGRMAEACEKSAPVVVLSIDSPGGDVAGLFDTARAIRKMCDDAGKRLLAHVEGQACSAAYALATAAESIMASRTAEIGSIGVVAARLDETQWLDKMGIGISLITSGDRKADGWSCASMSKDELASLQSDVDGLAAEFFDVVHMSRGISTEEIAAQEAACFRGSAALDAGLVDELGSFDHLIASLGAENEGTMSKEEEAREALRSIAEDEDEEEEARARARRALAAMDEDKDEDAEDDGDESDAEDKEDEPEAEDEDRDEDAEEDEDDKEAKASVSLGTVSASTAAELASHGSKLERRVAKLERRDAAKERKRLIAAHGGVSNGMAKILGTKPIKEVKALLAELPRPKKPKLGDAAATATVSGTRGADQGQASQLPPDEAKAMRKVMGMESENFGIVDQGNKTMLGAPTSEGGES